MKPTKTERIEALNEKWRADVKPFIKAYFDVVDPAHAAYEAAVGPAEKAYEDAHKLAEPIRDAIIHPADKELEVHMAEIFAAHRKALEAIQAEEW
jgi:hypothetical protein